MRRVNCGRELCLCVAALVLVLLRPDVLLVRVIRGIVGFGFDDCFAEAFFRVAERFDDFFRVDVDLAPFERARAAAANFARAASCAGDAGFFDAIFPFYASIPIPSTAN